MTYNNEIDKKWLKIWKKNKINKFVFDKNKPKFYGLEMFSYPSSDTLHIGHCFNYAPPDSLARFKKMKGYNVFRPVGFDSFGLPAENYAIKTNTHPQTSTSKNIEISTNQIKNLGTNYDWNHYIETSHQSYYKWTQWLFLKLFENKLAYKKESPVNWCPSCNTTLANEQLVNGTCERCSSVVSKKNISQWFFKITDYVERLNKDIDNLDWPQSTKKIQKNWIGKSKGSKISFSVENEDFKIETFTTRIDTLFGATYIVISPESDLVKKVVTKENEKKVSKYQKKASNMSDVERMEADRDKTGVFSGKFAINPINNKKIPIWIADYVLEGYGTGCVMAVPAHDKRDFEFANKFDLPIIKVIDNKEENSKLPFIEEGYLINSGEYNDLTTKKAKIKITNDLNKEKKASFHTNYRLRDWLVSRQRYWGAPIPIVYCKDCGVVPEKEENLPIKLPFDVKFENDGKSPLLKHKEFLNCSCPKCGKKAKREEDTLDTFVCSSWYFLRYPDANNNKKAFNSDNVNHLLPVDLYVGGIEHAAGHLLYSRFITKFLYDIKLIDFEEPFKKLRHQGMILDSNGEKLSKRKGNALNPDEFVKGYGADVLRGYLMFGFSYEEGGPWKQEGLKSVQKFLFKVEDYFENLKNLKPINENRFNQQDEDFIFLLNKLIKEIEIDFERLHFNTVFSKYMEILNAILKYKKDPNSKILNEYSIKFLLTIAPSAPFLSEELWEKIGNKESIHKQKWPLVNEHILKSAKKEIGVQVNGKLRGTILVSRDDTKDKVVKKALVNENVAKHLGKKQIKKEIYIKNKILNLVV